MRWLIARPILEKMPINTPKSYSLDAGAVIGLNHHYPADLFPDLWPQLDAVAQSGRMSMAREAIREVERKADGANTWIQRHKARIQDPQPDDTFTVAMVTPELRDLIDPDATVPEGDPFVVALAKRDSLTVLTTETRRGGARKVPKVCSSLSIPCMGLVELFREEGWKFRLDHLQ